MKYIEFLITIHANSQWNELGQRQGHCDSKLSETGRQMAISLSKRVDVFSIKGIYTSDLKRAYHTAVPLSDRIGVPIVTWLNLREGNWQNHYQDPNCRPLPFDGPYEDSEALKERALRTMAKLAQSNHCSPILVVTHGAFLKNFMAATFPDRAKEYRGIRTALNRIRYSKGSWSIVSLNDDSHLQEAHRGNARLDKG